MTFGPIINAVKTFGFMVLGFAAAVAGPQPEHSRAGWVALAKGGFTIPDGRTAVAMLIEMNTLLATRARMR